MLIWILEHVVLPIGVCTASAHFYYAWMFAKGRSKMARAITLLLVASGIADVATLIFALTTVLGAYGALDPLAVLFLRFAIFLPGGWGAYTLHKAWAQEGGGE